MNILDFLRRNFIPKFEPEEKVHVLSVAKDFSKVTTGPDGELGGGAFRKLMLERLDMHEHIIVDLDGTIGYGSSWLYAAFGNIPEHIQKRITFKSDEDPTYIVEIEDYIRMDSKGS